MAGEHRRAGLLALTLTVLFLEVSTSTGESDRFLQTGPTTLTIKSTAVYDGRSADRTLGRPHVADVAVHGEGAENDWKPERSSVLLLPSLLCTPCDTCSDTVCVSHTYIAVSEREKSLLRCTVDHVAFIVVLVWLLVCYC